MVILIMGVSGSGKTTIGRMLAERLGCPFHDADEFHPPSNIRKMSSGIPLDDDDRVPWLDAIRRRIEGYLRAAPHTHPQPGPSGPDRTPVRAVITCSALKRSYRDRLIHPGEPIRLVYLHGDYETILSRMKSRGDHFFKPEMLRSQFEALEEPSGAEAIRTDIGHPSERIVESCLASLRR